MVSAEPGISLQAKHVFCHTGTRPSLIKKQTNKTRFKTGPHGGHLKSTGGGGSRCQVWYSATSLTTLPLYVFTFNESLGEQLNEKSGEHILLHVVLLGFLLHLNSPCAISPLPFCVFIAQCFLIASHFCHLPGRTSAAVSLFQTTY